MIIIIIITLYPLYDASSCMINPYAWCITDDVKELTRYMHQPMVGLTTKHSTKQFDFFQLDAPINKPSDRVNRL